MKEKIEYNLGIYTTGEGCFDKRKYYADVIIGANKIFDDMFGDLTNTQVKHIIQSFELLQNRMRGDSIFVKSPFEWVYFLEDVDRGLIKIGKSNNLPSRFSQHKRDYKFCGLDNKLVLRALCATSNGAMKLESYIHKQMATHRSYYEWYDIDKKHTIDFLMSHATENSYGYMQFENGVFVVLEENNLDNVKFRSNCSSDFPMKRLDPFYEDSVSSLLHGLKLNTDSDKLFDVLHHEITETIVCNHLASIDEVNRRIREKYLDIQDNFFVSCRMDFTKGGLMVTTQ